MVGYYTQGHRGGTIPTAQAAADLGVLMDYETRTFGVVHPDLTADQIGQVAASQRGLHYQVVPATLANVQAALRAGRLISLPLMTHGGPGGSKISPDYGNGNVYHALLLIGFDGSSIITDDSGISQGHGYKYDWSVLASANGAQNLKGQGPVMVELWG